MAIWLKRAMALAGGALLVLAAVLAFNTIRFRPVDPPEGQAVAAVNDPAAVDRLAQAVRIPTISREAAAPDAAAFGALHRFLAASYPEVHEACPYDIINTYSILFTCGGKNLKLLPILLAAHQDVVPVETGSDGKWTHPAFAGVVADGFVWGRGTMDDKIGVLAILEAMEARLASGWRPERTVYLAFGHDEEIGGGGSIAMAALLKSRGVRLDLVVDEGLAVTEGIVPSIDGQVAMIGTAEKGFVSVELTGTSAGGHSSMPTDDNAILSVARALGAMQRDQHPARLDGAMAAMLDRVGPHMGLGMRVALANRWLTESAVVKQLLGTPSTAASVRTTTAPTIIAAGTKQNVLPQSARAVVNHRILPGDSIAGVVAHDRAAINDPSITVTPLPGGREPSPVSPVDGRGFAALERAIARNYPGAIIAPALTIAGTDARNYTPIADAIFRFTPMVARPDDLARIHGTDERIGIAAYGRAIAFYSTLLEEAAGPAK